MSEDTEVRNVGGRPLLFETPEVLADAVNQYLQGTDREELTVTGLCLAIGTSRETLRQYEEKEGYKDIVTRAKLYIENAYELSLRKHGRSGDIFALKNFGWKDKMETDLTSSDGSMKPTQIVLQGIRAESSNPTDS